MKNSLSMCRPTLGALFPRREPVLDPALALIPNTLAAGDRGADRGDQLQGSKVDYIRQVDF